MLIRENVSLKPFNTFGMDVLARWYAEVASTEDMLSLIKDEKRKDIPRFILGGGSNILFLNDYYGMVVRNLIKGISIERENEEEVWIKANSGEVWHDLVLYSLEKGLGGIENLSLIPGTVGAAPIQNIGAYGVELRDVFHSLEVMDLKSGEIRILSKAECDFGYRDSIFKKQLKGKCFILSVTLVLKKYPEFNINYGAIKTTLDEMGVSELSAKAISKAVCYIRQSKLPDPAVIGNAGSFFKNPEIPLLQYETLRQEYPDMPSYPVGEGFVKVPAGWLIEACGWRGMRVGETGSHKDQALVLVNYGNAKGEDIWQLAIDIQSSVKETFGVLILPEVNVL